MIGNWRESRAWLLASGLFLFGVALAVVLGSSLDTLQVQAAEAVEVNKSVDQVSVLPGQVPAPVYTVTFTNPGPEDVVLDAITDTLPADFLFVDVHPSSDWKVAPDDDVEPEISWHGAFTVPAGETRSLVYTVYVPGAVPPSTSPYVNTVMAVSGESTIGPASARLFVGEADLSLNKRAMSTYVAYGEPVTYTVVVDNSGQVTGTIEALTDTLDPGLTFEGMLDGPDPTDQSSGQVVWEGPFEVSQGGSLTLRYWASTSAEPVPSRPCNQAEALTTDALLGPEGVCVSVGPETSRVYFPIIMQDWAYAYFTLDKSASPTVVTAGDGQDVTFTVDIVNPGDTTGKIWSVYDVLPAGFTYQGMVSGSDVMDDPDTATGTITWEKEEPWIVPPGSQLRLIYRASPPEEPGVYTNSVNVTVEEASPPEGPASATVTVKPDVLLEDDFNSGIGLWTPFLNYGRLEEGQWYWGPTDGVGRSGALTHNCCAGSVEAHDALMMYLGQGAEQWTDYQLETKIIFRTIYYPQGVWVRGQYEPSDTRGQWTTGYYVMVGGGVGGTSHFVRLLQLQTLTDCWGNACNNPSNLYAFFNPHELQTVTLPGELERHIWHTLKVEVRGNRIQAWLNGQKTIDYVDTKEPFLTGTVGFKTYRADTVSYDNLVVTPLD
ncbi:MAG: DUF1080 domain-containing protein [Anaerolineae bacterium]